MITPHILYIYIFNALVIKALGEKLVREVIPDATIVRPGIMYGHEDRFLNRIGGKLFINMRWVRV